MYKEFNDLESYTQNILLSVSALSNRSKAVSSVESLIGLESSSLVSISTEGVVDWVKDKLAKLKRKVELLVNKLYAKLTLASEATRKRIEKAKDDPNVKLPLSSKKVAAIVAATTAVVALLTGCVAFDYSQGAKLNKIIEESKAAARALRSSDTGSNEFGTAVHEVNMTKASIHESNAKLADNVLRRNRVYKLAKTLQACFAKMRAGLKSFTDKFTNFEKQAANKTGEKKSFFAMLKTVGSRILKVFSAVRTWFAALPDMFKHKPKG